MNQSWSRFPASREREPSLFASMFHLGLRSAVKHYRWWSLGYLRVPPFQQIDGALFSSFLSSPVPGNFSLNSWNPHRSFHPLRIHSSFCSYRFCSFLWNSVCLNSVCLNSVCLNAEHEALQESLLRMHHSDSRLYLFLFGLSLIHI